MAISRAQEIELGKGTADQIREHYREKLLPASDKDTRRVARVLWRLVHRLDPDQEATDGYMLKHPWSVHVIRDPTENAFVVPGGYVFVFTGMLERLRNDGELAAVLGHEMAHVLARHTAEGLSWQYYFALLQLALISATVVFIPVEWDLGIRSHEALAGLQYLLANMFMNLPFSRQKELEADYIGQRVSARACYSPWAAAQVWEGFLEGGKGRQPPAFISTHPAHADRKTKLEEWAPDARRVLEDARCDEFLHWLRTAGPAALRAPNEFTVNQASVHLFDRNGWAGPVAEQRVRHQRQRAEGQAGVQLASAIPAPPGFAEAGVHVGPSYSPAEDAGATTT